MTTKTITKRVSMRGKAAKSPSTSIDTPHPPPQRVSRLKTLDDVRIELAKVYREARIKELPMHDAKGLAYLLQGMSAVLKDTELERRIAALEGEKP